MGLKQKVVQSLGWNLTGSLVIQCINFITKIVLARLLFPADFGLFAMVFIFINFLNIFVGFGISSAIIYRKEEPEKTLNTAVVLTTTIGIVLFFISYFSSSFIAVFFNQDALGSMIKVVSIVFLFDSLSILLYATFIKELEFKKKTIIDIFSVVGYSIIVVLLVFFGLGVWGLIISYVIQHLFVLILLWIFSPRRPSLEFDKCIAKEIFHFGKYALATSVIAWAITSIDNIIIGKRMGNENLGYYSMGFSIAALPVLSFTHIITAVFHPVYAKLQDEPKRLKEAYLKPLEWSLILVLPFSVGLFILADILVFVVFGERWLPIVPLLKIFAVYCILRTVCTIISQLLEGIGKPKRASMLLFIEFIILIMLLFPLISMYGTIGAAIAVISARAVSMVLHLVQVNNLLTVTGQEYLFLLWKKVFCAGIMAIGIFCARYLLFENTLYNFILLISIGIFIYSFFLACLEKRIFLEAKEIIKKYLAEE